MIFDKQGVQLRQQGGGIAARIFSFGVEDESSIDIEITYLDGRCSYSVIQIPGPIGILSAETYTEWHFPTIIEGDSLKQKSFSAKAHKGVYGLRILNENPVPSSLTFNLSLTDMKIRFPRFYNIGAQILVVGIPLIITSFFS